MGIGRGRPGRVGLLWAGAGALFAYRLWFWSRQAPIDLQPHWENLRALLAHRQVYTDPSQVFPPSFLVLAAPLGLLSLRSAMVVMVLVNAAAIAAAVAITLELLGVRWRSAAGAASLLALCFLGGVSAELALGNVNGLILLCEVGIVLAFIRGRWVASGALLGLSLAIKPTLVPLVLPLLLWRRWAALAVAMAVPAALVLLGLVVAAGLGADRFFAIQLPSLLHGLPVIPHHYNVSLAGAGESLGVPTLGVTAARLLLAAGAARLLWSHRAGPPSDGLGMLELQSFVLLLGLVESSFLWEAYSIFMLPLMVSLVRPDSVMRRWPALLGAMLISFPTTLLERAPIHLSLTLRWQLYTVGYLLLLGALATRVGSRAEGRSGGSGLIVSSHSQGVLIGAQKEQHTEGGGSGIHHHRHAGRIAGPGGAPSSESELGHHPQ